MNSRRAALLATSVTIAFLAGSAGTAAAAPDDELEAASNTTVVQGGTGAAADGLLACYPANPTAATAADLINYKRGLRGADPLMFDLELSTVAQAWADHLAEIGASDFNPDLISQLPEVPIPGSTIYEWVVTGSATADQIEFVLQVWQDEGFANGDSTHMGVGWATDDGGTAYLYFFFVQYEFSDIGPDAKFYDEVIWLFESNITTGFADGTFRPQGAVSREAMAAFLFRLKNPGTADPVCTGADRAFTDVTVGNPFCGAIEWLADRDVVKGWPDGTFRPGQPVSREAMAAFLHRDIVGGDDPVCTGDSGFSDVATANPFCGAVQWMADAGISTGWPDGTFRPASSVERQAMAAFLFRAASR